MKIARLEAEASVINMFTTGFSLPIAGVTVGCKASTCKSLWKAFNEINKTTENAFVKKKDSYVGFYKTSRYATTAARMMLISEFLNNYKLFGNRDIKESINLKAVIYAYNIVKENNKNNPDMFSVNGAWYIARDYRSETIIEKKCGDCGVMYALVEDQLCNIHSCPYCHSSKMHKSLNQKDEDVKVMPNDNVITLDLAKTI